jgi:hypothetical protein
VACASGSCSFTCNSGYSLCNGACVNFQTDTNNCGGCGSGYACAAAHNCQAGVCASCTQMAHTSGLSSPATYYDCNPTGNSQSQALSACQNSGGTGCTSKSTCCQSLIICLGSANGVCGTVGGTSYCWIYNGNNANKVTTGANPGCNGGNSWN